MSADQKRGKLDVEFGRGSPEFTALSKAAIAAHRAYFDDSCGPSPIEVACMRHALRAALGVLSEDAAIVDRLAKSIPDHSFLSQDAWVDANEAQRSRRRDLAAAALAVMFDPGELVDEDYR